MKRLRVAIASVWLAVGAAIGASCIADIHTALGQRRTSEVHAALIFLVFSAVAVSGGFDTIRQGRWGPIVLYVGSAFGLLYGGLYWLFGGVEDTGWLYASGVGALILLSLATLVGVRQEVQAGAVNEIVMFSADIDRRGPNAGSRRGAATPDALGCPC